MGACDDAGFCDICIAECDKADNLSMRNVNGLIRMHDSSCELCLMGVDEMQKSAQSYSDDSPGIANYIDGLGQTSPMDHEQDCDCCVVRSLDTKRDMTHIADETIQKRYHQRNIVPGFREESVPCSINNGHTPMRGFSKFVSKKYRKFRNRFRSKSSPPCEDANFIRRVPNHSLSRDELDCNMNQRCSICEGNCDEDESESNWESLLACSCKSKSLIDIENLSLFAHPTPSRRGECSIISCDCCQGNLFSRHDITDNLVAHDVHYDIQSCASYCEICAKDAEVSHEVFCEECAQASNRAVEETGHLISKGIMTVGELKKYGGMPPNPLVGQQPDSPPKIAKTKQRRRRKIEFSKSAPVERWVDNFGLCLQCVFPKHGFNGSNSSGSGSDDEGGDEEGEPEEEYEEHGNEVSDNEDSDGGDSGSESMDDDSMNSAELFDDQLNAFDTKDNNALDGSDDGGDGPGSECTDSLTELGTEDSEDESDSSEDDDDSFSGDAENDSSDGLGSMPSIILYEER